MQAQPANQPLLQKYEGCAASTAPSEVRKKPTRCPGRIASFWTASHRLREKRTFVENYPSMSTDTTVCYRRFQLLPTIHPVDDGNERNHSLHCSPGRQKDLPVPISATASIVAWKHRLSASLYITSTIVLTAVTSKYLTVSLETSSDCTSKSELSCPPYRKIWSFARLESWYPIVSVSPQAAITLVGRAPG